MQSIVNFLTSYIITIPFLKKPFQDLKHPEKSYGMQKAMNLNIALENGEDHIGAWFLQPLEDQNVPALPKSDDEQFLPLDPNQFLVGQDQTLILYLHGNAETRAQHHRRVLYEIFQKMGYFVLAIDYRCYADSSKLFRPTQTTMVEDANTAFDWISKNSHPEANIIIWGHRYTVWKFQKFSLTIFFAKIS